LLLQAYIPGITVLKNKAKKEVDMTVRYSHSKKQKILHKNNTIIIYDDWSREIPIYFFHLIYSIVHELFLKKSHYSIHSACIYKNGQGSLLLGHTGVGKTTVMLSLVENYKFKVFSSNKTLVGFNTKSELEAIAGTTTITYKNDNNSKNAPDKLINFVNRCAYKLPDEYLCSEKKGKIRKVYNIKLNPFVEECVKLNKIESIITVYPSLFDYINADIILFNGLDLYDGGLQNISAVSKKVILKHLAKALESMEVYNIAGSLEFIGKIINKNYDKT
ncbi:MAG: hypothetical protein NT094_03970, partial [Candidatus Staskawiczbacteria bacterium]|nr:hypothetical protein [Candidatus Staskawiczbacteria bacterium]